QDLFSTKATNLADRLAKTSIEPAKADTKRPDGGRSLLNFKTSQMRLPDPMIRSAPAAMGPLASVDQSSLHGARGARAQAQGSPVAGASLLDRSKTPAPGAGGRASRAEPSAAKVSAVGGATGAAGGLSAKKDRDGKSNDKSDNASDERALQALLAYLR